VVLTQRLSPSSEVKLGPPPRSSFRVFSRLRRSKPLLSLTQSGYLHNAGEVVGLGTTIRRDDGYTLCRLFCSSFIRSQTKFVTLSVRSRRPRLYRGSIFARSICSKRPPSTRCFGLPEVERTPFVHILAVHIPRNAIGTKLYVTRTVSVELPNQAHRSVFSLSNQSVLKLHLVAIGIRSQYTSVSPQANV
jgi:hypothetical protein